MYLTNLFITGVLLQQIRSNEWVEMNNEQQIKNHNLGKTKD